MAIYDRQPFARSGLRHRRVDGPSGFLLDEDERIEQLEDLTEDLLEDLFDDVAPRLHAGFERLRNLGHDQLNAVVALVSDLGGDVSLAKSDYDLAKVAWRPIARSTVFALFRTLLPLVNEETAVAVRAEELAKQALRGINEERFAHETALDPRDFEPALYLAAHALADTDRLDHPRFFFLRGTQLSLTTDRTGGFWAAQTSGIPFGIMGPFEGKIDQDADEVEIYRDHDVTLRIFDSGVEFNRRANVFEIAHNDVVLADAGELRSKRSANGEYLLTCRTGDHQTFELGDGVHQRQLASHLVLEATPDLGR